MNKYGLIGYPLGHSFSQRYFSDKFKHEGIDAEYSLYPLENIQSFPSLLEENKNLVGLNVTIPYKESVMSYLDELSEEGEAIGAVNVIKIERESGKLSLKGFNSDFVGFTKSLKPLLRPDVKKALVLGTGGASKAVCYALRKLNIDYVLVSRTPATGMISYSQLNEAIMGDNLLIVNTTPLGMFPHTYQCPPIPYDLLTPNHVCYDLVYNPEVTEFMKKSAEQGATVKNGLEMLHLQADRAWEIWTD